MDFVKNTLISALEKDINRRYISVVPLQADGRLQLDGPCVDVLAPKAGEKFYLINDNSSIIIARNPIPAHKDKIISSITFSSIGKKRGWRLRLPQIPMRILLTCKVGFRVFLYGKEVALEAEPYIAPIGLDSANISSLEDLAPFVLRSSRSILHLNCVIPYQNLVPSELNFRLLGEYWKKIYHQDPLDSEFKMLPCTGLKCQYCEQDFVIVKNVYWFPVIAYSKQQYARPALLSFKMPVMENVCAEIIDDCEQWVFQVKKSGLKIKKYCESGIVSYPGNNLYQISSNGKIDIVKLKQDDGFTVEEKGLMKLSQKEMDNFIRKIDNIK